MVVKKKKKPKYNENSAIRSALRRTFSRSPIVREVMQDGRRERQINKKDGTPAKRPRVEFQCSECKGWFMGKDVQVDHKEPVVPITGYTDWNTFITRLFCAKENLEILCKPDHKIKTKEEGDARRAYKKNQSV